MRRKVEVVRRPVVRVRGMGKVREMVLGERENVVGAMDVGGMVVVVVEGVGVSARPLGRLLPGAKEVERWVVVGAVAPRTGCKNRQQKGTREQSGERSLEVIQIHVISIHIRLDVNEA
jgi:hypothetical protein